MLPRRQESLADKPTALLTSTACMTTCHQDRLRTYDGKSCHPGSATGNLYCNNVLPGTATGYIFQLPTANSAAQEQEPDNFGKQRLIVPFRTSNRLTSRNMATCHRDPEPELDYRLELDVLWYLVFFWIASDVGLLLTWGRILPLELNVGQCAILKERVATCHWMEQQLANRRFLTANLYLVVNSPLNPAYYTLNINIQWTDLLSDKSTPLDDIFQKIKGSWRRYEKKRRKLKNDEFYSPTGTN